MVNTTAMSNRLLLLYEYGILSESHIIKQNLNAGIKHLAAPQRNGMDGDRVNFRPSQRTYQENPGEDFVEGTRGVRTLRKNVKSIIHER